MKKLEEGDPEYYWVGYKDIIGSFEHEIVVSQNIGSWQGDTLLVLRDGDRHGFLVYGWGSCSGCDAAQACKNVAEATELRDKLYNSIKWFSSKDELLVYLQTKDHGLEYYGHEDKQGLLDFLAECNKVLV